MYTYLLNTNSKSRPGDQLLSRISDELKKLHIEGKILEFANEQQLYSSLVEIDKSSTNTLVLIGDDRDFELFVGQAGKIKEDLAVGYIPLTQSEIAKQLQIKDWLSAVEALAKRKIKETKIYSVANRFFLTILDFTIQNESKKQLPIQITTEANLTLNLPIADLRLESSADENIQTQKPIVLSAKKHMAIPNPSEASNIFGFIRKQIKTDQTSSEQILHLPIKAAKISFEGQATDNIGRSYSKSIIIGKYQKTLRLITSKSSSK